MHSATASAEASAPPARTLGGFAIGEPLRQTLCAAVFRAERAGVAATIHVVHPALAAHPDVVRAIVDQAPRAAAVVGVPNLGATLGGGVEDGALYVLTEAEDGPPLTEVLARKHASDGAGLPPRGAGHIVSLVAAALGQAGLVHGALTADSIIVGRTSGVVLADLALGPAMAAAIAAGLVEVPAGVAPEAVRGAAPAVAADVYGLGALLYHALVGRPLARGGPRPSEVAAGVPPEADELIARACAERPERRFASGTALRELVVDVLVAAEDEAGASGTAAARQVTLPPALIAAMEDPYERWLVNKGRIDFGPFAMKQIVEQILGGQILHGHVLFDNEAGGRAAVDEHPLLGPLVEAARQARDDARRANAEVKQQASERKRGVALYGVIGLGVTAAALTAWFVVDKLTTATRKEVAGVATVAEASLDVKVSAPKAPPKKAASARRGGGGGGGDRGGGDGDENLTLDMSDDGDGGSETLDMDTVYGVYARYGAQLGRCLFKTGASSAQISIIINGPTGKVTWVKVNGTQSGPLHGCLSGVLRSMKFPTIDGPRTRAEFEIGV
ncbi:MAG: hypothetical protein R3B06_19150 [Kofleriaceae bacterium]